MAWVWKELRRFKDVWELKMKILKIYCTLELEENIEDESRLFRLNLYGKVEEE